MHNLLEQTSSGSAANKVVDYFIITLVIANIVAFILSTVPGVEDGYGSLLERFEQFSVLVFTIEYILRIWAAAEFPFARDEATWLTRLKYAVRPLQIIDFIAIAPFYLSFLFAIDLRLLRILRLFRLLKLARYSPAMQAMVVVFANEKRSLFGALLLMICLLLFASTFMYFAEHVAQPEHFGSVPAAMWWAISTLTTVGYGDVTPVTMFGKILAGFVMLLGLGMFALPIGIIATGFAQETQRREFVISWSMVANVPFFSGLKASEIAEILPRLNSVTFNAGETISHQGDIASEMYFIASGKVVIEFREKEVLMEKGQFFGEMALLEHRARAHNVRAETDCRLLMLEAKEFLKLMRGKPKLLKKMRKIAKRRSERSPV